MRTFWVKTDVLLPAHVGNSLFHSCLLPGVLFLNHELSLDFSV